MPAKKTADTAPDLGQVEADNAARISGKPEPKPNSEEQPK